VVFTYVLGIGQTDFEVEVLGGTKVDLKYEELLHESQKLFLISR